MKRVYALVGIMLLISGCASGLGLVSGQKHPSIDPLQVMVLPQTPPNQEILGVVDTRVIGMDSLINQNDMINELKKQAAAIGANAIVLKPISTTLYTKMDRVQYGWMSTLTRQTTLSATAIYVAPNP